MTSSAHFLDGVVVPLVTPLSPDGRPRSDDAAPHLAALADAGITTLMLLGSNGEGAALPADEAAAVARDLSTAWRARVGSGARILVAAFGSSTRLMLATGDLLLTAEPDAVVVPAPHYFRHSAEELRTHFAAAAGLGVPIVAYNIPRYTGNPLTPELVRALADMPHLIGIKDSSGDAAVLEAGLAAARERPDYGLSQGDERALVRALAGGATGITPGLANIAPAACLALVTAVRAGDIATAAALQERLAGLLDIHRVRAGVPAMKAALALLGLGTRTPSAPFRPFDDAEDAALRGILSLSRDILAGALDGAAS